MKRTSATRTPRVIKRPPRKGVEQRDQHGHERPGIIICPDCGNVHYHKRWWKNSDAGLKRLVVMYYRTAAHTRCPACTMKREHLFEGELVVVHVPARFRGDVIRHLRNFAKTASERDPQDRILEFQKRGSTIRVTTTENQLADRLGKALRNAFKQHARVRMSHSREPYEVDRVTVQFS